MIRPADEIIYELVSTGLTHHQTTLLVQLVVSLPSRAEPPVSDWKEKDRQRSQRYRDNRRANGMSTYFRGDKYKADLLGRDGSLCIYCGDTPGCDIDHMLPISAGGTDDLDNLGMACRPCNSGKGGRTPDEARMTFASKTAKSAYQRYLTARTRADDVADDVAGEGADESRPALILSSLPLEKRTFEEVSKEERKKERAKNKRKPAIPLPDDWAPNAAHYAAARALGHSDGLVVSKATDMRLWALSKDERKVSWDATFHGFLRREKPTGANNATNQGGSALAAIRELKAELRQNRENSGPDRAVVVGLPPRRLCGP
jgi:5-methylcytosine-specific restriction endonuclease McrA